MKMESFAFRAQIRFIGDNENDTCGILRAKCAPMANVYFEEFCKKHGLKLHRSPCATSSCEQENPRFSGGKSKNADGNAIAVFEALICNDCLC